MFKYFVVLNKEERRDPAAVRERIEERGRLPELSTAFDGAFCIRGAPVVVLACAESFVQEAQGVRGVLAVVREEGDEVITAAGNVLSETVAAEDLVLEHAV